MNVTSVVEGLQSGLKAVNALSSVATSLGVSSEAVSIAGSLASIASNALDKIDKGEIVANSRDRELIRSYINDLAAVNDGLAKQIVAS